MRRPSHHVVELLAPLDPTIPHTPGQVTDHAVAFERTADDWVQMVFPELSRPGKMVARAVACVNREQGCRCDFVRMIRSVLVLTERQVLRVTARYVISSFALSAGSEAMPIATIQLFFLLHERATRSNATSLKDFELLLCHLQPSLMDGHHQPTTNRMVEQVERAKRSSCHVVGCELHTIEDATQDARFTLSEVFERLTSIVNIDQMPIRDDATYFARMKRARREFVLTDMPVNILHEVVRMMDARDLAAISSVCTMFQHMAYEVVPGMKLLLYHHQRKALKWMLYREGSTRADLFRMPHPFLFPSASAPVDSANPQDEGDDLKAIDLIDGQLVRQNIRSNIAMDARGGLFCDEPGLGKTITMLALVLRTRGQRSDVRSREQEEAVTRQPGQRNLRSSENRGRVVKTDTLETSAATLIVVPNPLIDHWRYQIEMHLTPNALDVFIDDADGKKDLPSPQDLAKYDVVITSIGRLASEWKHRRPISALEERRPDRYGYEDGPQRFVDGFVCRGASSLLGVHWVRVVVDEGHKLGGTNPTHHMRMARVLHADKRWVMTGTPTPSTLQSADLRHMHGLLVFLRDRPYGDPDAKIWLKAIARPFEINDRTGYLRLLHLLNRLMIRHTKDSVQTLIPAPIRHTVIIDPTPNEYTTYNSVAAVARANLFLTNIDKKTPGKQHPDSLLNPKNRKYAAQALRNLREATYGGYKMLAIIKQDAFVETINDLNKLGVNPDLQAEAVQYLRRVGSTDVLTECKACGRHLQLLMLLPCGHLACCDCVESRFFGSGPSCLLCDASYDRDVLQTLQPGFEYESVEDQWTYHDVLDQGGQANGQERGDGNTIAVPQRDGNRQRIRPINIANFSTVIASKAIYVAHRIRELRRDFASENSGDGSRQNYWDTMTRPTAVKAIIFSQFREHIWRVKVALAQHGILCEDFFTGVSTARRMRNLLRFRHDPSSNVLLLTDVGSHGLDLSFVTHIFLMEEIWDKSLEQQVVSRAHRMGARHSVVVEQLLMRGSIEVVMYEMNKKLLARESGGVVADGQQESDDDAEVVDNPAPASRNTAAHGVLDGLFTNKKHKRKHKTSSSSQPQLDHNSNTSERGKATIRHRQLSHILQGVHLIREDQIAGDDGFARYEVTNNSEAVVREGRIKLPDARDRQMTAPQTPTSAPTQRPPVQAMLPPRSTSTTTSPPMARPAASSASDHSAGNGSSTSIPRRPNSASAASARVKIEAPSTSQQKHHRQSSEMIDLTASEDDEATPAPINRAAGKRRARVGFRDEWVDSETEDEQPKRTSKSPGKKKKKRVAFGDDDDDDDDDDWRPGKSE
ncbi:hypothetical protein Poli38472_000848 [Pythium oligandrum]|uniref:F-box protein n=1 Tax=Pythium oligandrum TaxID=41045 RepID=A0A8K1CDB0_PYTOL|nr:hypothetical protein Poli38472_000848 [Pythium oligandrum]|eukprot:TMW60806.1 hypothetical protein Poli38472_000848 [Pythium oligandrum]